MGRNTFLFFMCLLARASGKRFGLEATSRDTEGQGEGSSFGCDVAKTCAACLATRPVINNELPFLGAGHFCKWCPHQHWSGSNNLAGSEGTCRPAKHDEEDCHVWYFPRPSPTLDGPDIKLAPTYGVVWGPNAMSFLLGHTPNGASILPHSSPEDALEVCPASLQSLNDAHLIDNSGEDLLTMRIKDADQLDSVLYKLTFDLVRLLRFRFTNPVVFERMFKDMDSVETAAATTWKGALWTMNFISSLGPVQFILESIEGLAVRTRNFLRRQYSAQDKLIRDGRNAKCAFFDDVSLGYLYDAYKEVMNLTMEETQDMVEQEAKQKLLDASHPVYQYKKIHDGSYKTIKKVSEYALFAGGFFTAGATWLAGDIWDGVDLAADTVSDEIIKMVLYKKTRLLVGLARLQLSSLWDSSLTKCDITTGEDPCSDMVDGQGNTGHGVCVRDSPWRFPGETGALSSEGRCFFVPEKAESLLRDGSSCAAHSQCQSSFCHFETKMQYFFSDHDRIYSDDNYTEAVPIPTQLRSLNVLEPVLPGEVPHEKDPLRTRPMLDFVGQYNSGAGVKYSTIGTCARACPKSEVGKGECAALAWPGAKVDFDFGLRFPNRLISSEGGRQQVYAVIGKGACSDKEQLLPVIGDFLMENADHAAHVECAKKCTDIQCSAFKVYESKAGGWKCHLHDKVVVFTMSFSGGLEITGTCYGRDWGPPLDAHQPWNQAWYFYMYDVSRVVSLLMQSGWEMVLRQVQRAYPKFCQHGSETPGCKDPRSWDRATAIEMLTHDAPLSVGQMRKLMKKVDPHHTDAAFANSRRALLRDLFADPEWGIAWQRKFGSEMVEMVRHEHPLKPYTMQAKFAQHLQMLARGHMLKHHDGVWDLFAAEREYDAAAGQWHLE